MLTGLSFQNLGSSVQKGLPFKMDVQVFKRGVQELTGVVFQNGWSSVQKGCSSIQKECSRVQQGVPFKMGVQVLKRGVKEFNRGCLSKWVFKCSMGVQELN